MVPIHFLLDTVLDGVVPVRSLGFDTVGNTMMVNESATRGDHPLFVKNYSLVHAMEAIHSQNIDHLLEAIMCPVGMEVYEEPVSIIETGHGHTMDYLLINLLDLFGVFGTPVVCGFFR